MPLRIKYVPAKRLKQLQRNHGSKRYQDWRKAVIDRDCGTCQHPNCFYGGDKIQVHHIKRFANNPHLRYATYNGICLCPDHHKLVTGNEEAYELLYFKIVRLSEKQQKERENDDDIS